MNPLRLAAWHLAALLALLVAGPAAGAKDAAPKGYPFARPPLEVFDRLAAPLGGVAPIPPAERGLLAEVWAARSATPRRALAQADDAAVTAHLVAGGAESAAARKAYLAKFAALAADAERATEGAKTDRRKADLLLRFLHQRAMTGGYALDSTTLPELLDSGKFNCVSSSELYYLVGTRLGLNLRAVLIPGGASQTGHAAIDLLTGGKRVQVEPTNPDGFDWPAKLKQPGVVAVGPQPDRSKGYDADGHALAASAASNRGAQFAAASPPRPAEAVRCLALALALAPSDPSAAHNLPAVVSNWGLKLAGAGKYEEALRVYAAARAALGPNEFVDRNHRAVWADATAAAFDAGRAAEGAKLLARFARAFPDATDAPKPAECVAAAARKLAGKPGAGWGAALKFADDAARELPAADAKAVRDWKPSARRIWSQELLKSGDAGGSLAVLADGLAESPGSRELAEGVAFHAQESLAAAKTPAAAARHYKLLRAKFPASAELPEVAASAARRAVARLADAGKFAAALKLASAYAPLAGDCLADIRAGVYDAWATSLAAGSKPDALAKYLEGLDALPGNARLRNNATVLIDGWARPARDKSDWAEAVRVYDVGLRHFPDDSRLKHNREVCLERAGK